MCQCNHNHRRESYLQRLDRQIIAGGTATDTPTSPQRDLRSAVGLLEGGLFQVPGSCALIRVEGALASTTGASLTTITTSFAIFG